MTSYFFLSKCVKVVEAGACKALERYICLYAFVMIYAFAFGAKQNEVGRFALPPQTRLRFKLNDKERVIEM